MGLSGKEIRRLRARLHITQPQLAELLGWDHSQQVSYLENDRRKVLPLTEAILRLIERALCRRPAHEIYRHGIYTLHERLMHIAAAAAGTYESGSNAKEGT